MNTCLKIAEIHTNSYLPVFVDISKDYLDCSVGWESARGSRACRIAYQVEPLSRWIETLMEEYGIAEGRQIHFVCEPTGGLQHKLMLVARQYGASLRYVNPERMYNARMITYGNSEKTDPKDPGAIRNLYLIGGHRRAVQPDEWHQMVRALSREYENLSQQAIQARNRIHSLMRYVFVDYSKPASFTFSRSGQALAALFGFSPHRMLESGYADYRRRLKQQVPRIRRTTLQEVWRMAQRSVALSPAADSRAEYLGELYRQWMQIEQRKQELRQRLQEYGELYQQRGWIPRHLPPRVSRWMLVRIIAETGPLEEFAHIRQLWAFLGLKLACRQSGKYKGQIKITKKGPALLRKLLYQICLPLVKTNHWMHAKYRKHNPKGSAKGKGIRAMNVVMRKVVSVLYAMHKSGSPFQVDRLSCCQSQYTVQPTATVNEL